MSDTQFPNLSGLSWDVARTPTFRTLTQTSASGLELRAAFWSRPRWQWSLSYDLLRADATADLQTLAGFFLARQGSCDSFLYTDPNDKAVTGQAIGTGDGTTTAFQLVRSFGGYLEPVTAVQSLTLYKADWQGAVVQSTTARENLLLYSQAFDNAAWTKNTASLTADAATAPDGSMTADSVADTSGTYFGSVSQTAALATIATSYTGSVYLKADTSTEADLEVGLIGGTGGATKARIDLTAGTVSLVTGPGTFGAVAMGGGWYRIWVQQPSASGNTTVYLSLFPSPLAAADLNSVFAWGAQIEAGSTPFAYIPTTSAAFSGPDYALGPEGVVTFTTAPASGAAITADITYAWRVRFTEDQAEFNEFMYRLFELKKLSFMSVK